MLRVHVWGSQQADKRHTAAQASRRQPHLAGKDTVALTEDTEARVSQVGHLHTMACRLGSRLCCGAFSMCMLCRAVVPAYRHGLCSCIAPRQRQQATGPAAAQPWSIAASSSYSCLPMEVMCEEHRMCRLPAICIPAMQAMLLPSTGEARRCAKREAYMQNAIRPHDGHAGCAAAGHVLHVRMTSRQKVHRAGRVIALRLLCCQSCMPHELPATEQSLSATCCLEVHA